MRVPKHEWNASCDGRCTRETTALEWNGPVDSPAQGRTIIARALRRATTDCPWPSASLSAPFFRARISPMNNAVACHSNNARASNSGGSGRRQDWGKIFGRYKPFQSVGVFCARISLFSYYPPFFRKSFRSFVSSFFFSSSIQRGMRHERIFKSIVGALLGAGRGTQRFSN